MPAYGVAVTNEVLRCLVPGKGFSYLSRNPLGARVGGHTNRDEPPSSMRKDHHAAEQFERNRTNWARTQSTPGVRSLSPCCSGSAIRHRSGLTPQPFPGRNYSPAAIWIDRDRPPVSSHKSGEALGSVMNSAHAPRCTAQEIRLGVARCRLSGSSFPVAPAKKARDDRLNLVERWQEGV